MHPAALRLFVGACALLIARSLDAAETPNRAAPSRPGDVTAAKNISSGLAPLPAKKLGGVDYVGVADVARALNLKATITDHGRRASLAGGSGTSTRADLERDMRDVSINGLRVFLGEPVLDSGGQLQVSRVDYERVLFPLLRSGQGLASPAVPKIIVLDPGHGGKDTGTSVNEKAFALDVARRAKPLLEAAGYRVVLTREADTFLDLAERGATANANRADVFVSIHFNALPNDHKTSGVEVFTFAPKGQHASDWWSQLRRDDPHRETTDMPVNRFDPWNVLLAQSLQRRFVSGLKTFDRGRKVAHWGVLRGLNCPGVLVECGFLTSDVESRKIATADYRQRLAEAVAGGVRDYVQVIGNARPKAAAVAETPAGAVSSTR